MKPPSLLAPVINCSWFSIRDPVTGVRCSCSLKWLLSTVRAEVDGAKHSAGSLPAASVVGLQFIAEAKDVSKAD